MQIRKVALVIFDIGGYTEFIKFHKDSLAHAHEIVSQLLENIVENAAYPLVLNKFEGDAALLYAALGRNETYAVADIARQIFTLFPAFRKKAHELAHERSFCPCGACQNIRDLRLKAVVHKGEAAFRKISRFDEMAGQDVILIHRLLKNSVEEPEYILITDSFSSLMDDSLKSKGRDHVESYDHLGEIALKLFDPSIYPESSLREPRRANWWRRVLTKFAS